MLPANLLYLPLELDSATRALTKLNKKRLKILEESTVLTTREKVNLLLLLLQQKWIADFPFDDPKEFERLKPELERLDLPYYMDFFIHDNGMRVDWIQVAANRGISKYIKEHKDILTALEAGALYGYPISAVLAFEGMLTPAYCPPADKNIVSFYLGGVYSADLYQEERKQMVRTWRVVEKASPRIAREAAEYLSSLTPNFTDEVR